MSVVSLLLMGLGAALCGPQDAVPLTQTLWDGGLGVASTACAMPRITVGPQVYAVIAPEQFYGQLRGTLVLQGELPVNSRWSLNARGELWRRQDVISSLRANYSGMGLLTLGAAYQLSEGRVPLSLSSHVVIPTALGLYDHSYPVALDVGLSAAFPLDAKLALYGHVGAVASASVSPGIWGERTGAVTTVGLGYQAFSWLTLVAETRAAFGYDAALDHISSGGGFRARYGAWGVSVEALLPWAGRERSLGAAGLSVGYSPR